MNTLQTTREHFISLEEAEKLTGTYRKNKGEILNGNFRGKDVLPICETFDRYVFDEILRQPGCTGIRIYFGMKEDMKISAVIVGVNEKDEDILPEENVQQKTMRAASAVQSSSGVGENGGRCPNVCPPASRLNR